LFVVASEYKYRLKYLFKIIKYPKKVIVLYIILKNIFLLTKNAILLDI